MASRTLLATAGPWISGSSLGDVLGTPELSTVDVLTGQTSLEALLACGTKYGAAIVLCDSGKMSLAPAFLGALVKSLEPGARVSVHTAAAASSISQDEIKSALVLSGFVPDCQSSSASVVIASTPTWGVGAKSALHKKPKADAAAAPAAAPLPAAAAAAAPGGAWKLAADDMEEDEELVDEDELLTEEDKQRPAPVAADDCEVGKAGRKACKNCTCGRAEAEAAGVKVQLTSEMIQNPGVGSSCGNCSLGDAFRCAGCPYRGLPAFEPGKPLQLPADFLVADA